MQLSDDYLPLLNSILAEWNRAEEDIKIAEQVSNKVVNPSIKELRYAGRRIVEALTKIKQNSDPKEIKSLLDDALFDCYRARHDAIDAGTSKIAIDLEIMVKKLGYDVIIPVYKDFPALLRHLRKVRDKIVESRRDRENREAIYSVLESCDFPALVSAYGDLRENEDVIRAMAKRRRRSELIGIGGFIVGIIGIGLAFYFWMNP